MKLKSLKPVAVLLWGILIFLVIFNQRIDLDYLQKERWFVTQETDFQYEETGKSKDNANKYRLVKKNGSTLFGYSQPENFTNILKFTYETPQTIRFQSRIHKTNDCSSESLPEDIQLQLNVGNSNYNLQHVEGSPSELRIKISQDDQISLYVQSSQPENPCGALSVKISRLERGSWPHFLIINSIWAVFIFFMLFSGRYLAPLFSGLLFYIFEQAELLYNTILSWEQLLLFTALSIGAGLLFSLVVTLGKGRFLVRVLSAALSCLIILITTALPVFVLGFNEMFDTKMNKYDWFAILQTDLNEVIEFIRVFAPVSLIIQVTAAILLLVVILIYSGKKELRYQFAQWTIIPLLALFVAIYYDTSSVLANSVSAISEYYEDIEQLKQRVKERRKRVNKLEASKRQTDEVYIVIIGESANRNHFSLYGYPRDTNPRLLERFRQKDLIRYDQAYSCGVSTRGSLQYALTEATLKSGSPSESPSLMEVLNAAEIETYWIHNGSTDVGTNSIGLIGEQADHTDHLSSIYGVEDGKLINEVDKVLAKESSSSKVIFLKTQGSHLEYCKRLPEGDEWTFADKDFDRWLIPDQYKLTKISAASNCFDGSIKYTDYVIDEIINLVEKSGKVASVLYFSDHGEEIVEGTAHMGKPPTYGVFGIPMALWFSESYKQRYQAKYENVKINAEKVFVNDALFDSVLGLVNVNYKGITNQNNITDSEFKNGKYIFRGKKTVYDSDNYLYHTPLNIEKIQSQKRTYSTAIGPILHPFHLSWLTGAQQYKNLVFAATFENGIYKLDSNYFTKSPVTLKTVFSYLPTETSQTFFIRINLPFDTKEEIQEASKAFLSLLKTSKIDRTQVVVTSKNHAYLEELREMDIKVSYWQDEPEVSPSKYQQEEITIDLDQISPSIEDLDNQPVNIWISSCDINNCDAEIDKRLENYSQKINIRRVILPMFSI